MGRVIHEEAQKLNVIGRARFAALSAALLLIAVACQAGATTTPGPTPTAAATVSAGAPTGDPYAGLGGDIAIDGSSTVFPISEAVGEEFGKLTGGNVRVTVGESGTGGGFKKFCVTDGTDISDASRPVKQEEVDLCGGAGVDFIELPVAIDGLTVVVNSENDWVGSMTVDQLKKLWEPAAEGVITRWNQIDPAWPDREIRLFGPGTASGTFDYFTEEVVGEAKASRGDYTASEDDNVLVQGVAGDTYALGYFGFSYYENNQDRLRAVAIDGVLPSRETIADGTYTPLSRPLFIYVNTAAAPRPEVQGFVEYYLSDAGVGLVTEVQYVELPAEVQRLARDRFAAAHPGSAYHVAGFDPKGKSLQEIFENDRP